MSEQPPRKTVVVVGAALAIAGAGLWVLGLVALLSGPLTEARVVRAVIRLHVGLVMLCVGVLVGRYGLEHAASLPWGSARRWRFRPSRPQEAAEPRSVERRE
jgi:hypothetical protein